MHHPKKTRIQPVNNTAKTRQFPSKPKLNNSIKQVLLRLIVLNNFISDNLVLKKQNHQKENIKGIK
jgi:hypothetical protein